MAIQRPAVVMLALMGAWDVTLAVADSPPSPAATPAPADAASATAATPAVSTPATPATAAQNAAAAATTVPPADSAAKAAEAAQEKALLNAGWRPEMQHGQKVWCRREEVLGSRTAGKKVCGAADQIDGVGRQTRQDIMDSQKKLNTYPGH